MSPFQIMEARNQNKQLFGIQNIHSGEWVTDCFDYVRLYPSESVALEEKKNGYIDYQGDDYQVMPWSYEESMLR